MSIFRVAIHYGVNSNGFLSYDTDTKTVTVDLPEQEWVDKVRAYLNEERPIENATGLDTYERLQVKPLDSLDNFKLALTRMWEALYGCGDAIKGFSYCGYSCCEIINLYYVMA